MLRRTDNVSLVEDILHVRAVEVYPWVQVFDLCFEFGNATVVLFVDFGFDLVRSFFLVFLEIFLFFD